MRRLESATRHLVSHHRHRPGAASRWSDLRAGGQLALPFRCLVRAGESQADEEVVPRGILRGKDSAGLRLPAEAERYAGVSGSRWRDLAARGVADAGDV